jgi:hypothetical protein
MFEFLVEKCFSLGFFVTAACRYQIFFYIINKNYRKLVRFFSFLPKRIAIYSCQLNGLNMYINLVSIIFLMKVSHCPAGCKCNTKLIIV